MQNGNSEQTHTTDIGEATEQGEPSSNGSARAAQPESAQTLGERAESIREACHYNGRLTPKLFRELAPLLVQRTPVVAVEDSGADHGFAHLLWQRSVMDDVLLPIHWRDLTHYEDGGRTARAWVIVGNRLRRSKLHPTTGELRPSNRAEILKEWDGWGGVDRANSKGDLLKSSQTSALRRLLAQIGPGRDAFAPKDYAERASQYEPDTTAMAGAGEAKAEELDMKLLGKIVRDAGLPAGQVANLIRAAAGAPAARYESEAAAQAFVDERLDPRRIVLGVDLAPRLKRLLEEASAKPLLPALRERASREGGTNGDGRADGGSVPFDPAAARPA